MGCLNDGQDFEHWFGNIHLSGPCNRSCYFCIGQDMMGLDKYNVLDTWPLDGLDEFIQECRDHGIKEINLTGSNTEPLMYKHNPELVAYLRKEIPGVTLGLRTNAVLAERRIEDFKLFDLISISVTSFDHEVYKATMGQGTPPKIDRLAELAPDAELRANIVLVPEMLPGLMDTIATFAINGILRINLREPYGQPHMGNPLEKFDDTSLRTGTLYDMPQYKIMGAEVTYWDVHYVMVGSLNLYASGRISHDYSVTKGHSDYGEVKGQEHFKTFGRKTEQWVYA